MSDPEKKYFGLTQKELKLLIPYAILIVIIVILLIIYLIHRYNNKSIEGKIIKISYIKKTLGKYQHRYNLTIEVNNNNKIDTLELIKFYENNDSMLKKEGDNITIHYNLLFKNYSYLYAPKSYIVHKNIINYISSSILFAIDFIIDQIR